jgi:HlyD family secretion protein
VSVTPLARRADGESAPGPASGASMDRVLPRSRRAKWLRLGSAGIAAIVVLALSWVALPRGLAVPAADIDTALVQPGTFRDELTSRVTVAPLASVVLDATEGGRVEAVLVKDGASVKQGELLFRLSNPQRAQEVMARSADMAQQLANLSGMRAQLAASRLAQRRELAALEFEVDRAAKAHARNVDLAKSGFLSDAAVEESADRLRQQQRLLAQLKADGSAELDTREQSVSQMDSVIAGLGDQLKLTRANAEALAVRAPVDGRLTGFALQQGESVKPGDRVGRIDSAERFKLQARIDEFYLPRLAPGQTGSVAHQGQERQVTLTRIDPQVKDGRFGIELEFTDAGNAPLQAGQTLDARLTLGESAQALIVADGPFYADSGGAWVYVLAAGGASAERRNIQLGRRAAGRIEVLGGLQAGERVIVSGVQRFGDAPRLRIEKPTQ